MIGRIALIAATLLTPALAHAEDLCTERPGLGTSACTIGTGHVQVATGLAEWTREREDGERRDTVVIGSTSLRIGVGEASELRLGWTPYAQERERAADGSVETHGGVGDLRLGFKQNLMNPDGHGLSVALLPFAILPTGRPPAGAGTWHAGLIAPVTWDASDSIQLEFTPEVEAAANESGHGRHLAYSSVVGAEWEASKAIHLVAEVQAERDNDPDEHRTEWLAGLAAGWRPTERLQFDVGTAAGLNHDAPGLRVYGGVVAQF
ncbi:hypothetical protein GCM10011380_03950 [Sphingomonas metalli]|uniref:Transporter n=1 Tax=Sphingomonas metalli TaxID=1779358 RepID=A0A916SX22_9SPHN|nr:transporter [Sphingomonas metalli]GGB17636.1 hypothetical protein GCM10011380_03950 [Sphingomonas metalli]